MTDHYCKGFRLKNAFFILLVCLCSLVSYGQLSNFSLSVTKTDETCSGNGSLTFTTTGTTENATMVFSIFLLPDATNPIATQSGATINGLVAGNYRVVATQTLGSQSGSQQQDIAIGSFIIPLTFDVAVTSSACQLGSIQINVATGTAAGYEIFSGPLIVPVQTSNIFTGLPAGVYQARVFDNCGEGVVKTFTITTATPGMVIAPVTFPSATLPSCDSIKITQGLIAPAGTVIAYPLTAELTIFPPSGPTITQIEYIPGGTPNAAAVGATIPFYAGELYTYNLQVTDGCGNVYIRNTNNINKNLALTITTPPKGCSKALNLSVANFMAPYYVAFISMPAGFDPVVLNPSHPGPFSESAEYYNASVPIPEGLYVISVTDACGRTAQSQIQFVQDLTVNPLAAAVNKGCDDSHGSVKITSGNGSLVSVSVASAPASYTADLPQDVSFNIAGNGAFYMNAFPVGNYTFHTVDACNNILDVDLTIEPIVVGENQVAITQNCGTFDLLLEHQSNVSGQVETFWLQKYNAGTNQWGHPGTGFSNGGNPSIVNAAGLQNNTANLSFVYSGVFRVLKTFQIFNNGVQTPLTCVQEIYNFEFDGLPKIDAVYSFSCSGNTSDVVVEASGAAPLQYRITLKDGLEFELENNTNNLFSGLAPGIYNFQVEDNCGNILNRLFDISEPLVLAITPVNLCDGQNGALTLPALSFLNFEWWKGSDATTILSTGNALDFTPFSTTTDAGTYHVRVNYPNSNSCIDLVLDFEITPGLESPEAGTGTAVSYCGTPGPIDLFALLNGNFDTFGIWENLSGGGILTENIWDSSGVADGNFVFKYTVNGLCNAGDSATVNITVHMVPETPVAFLEQTACDDQPLQLLATTVSGASYQWAGPNGFTSNVQNPLIENASVANNGDYMVKAIANGCESGTASVAVAIEASPQFTLEHFCDGDNFTIQVIPAGNSFDPNAATYSWTGPNSFSANGNPIVITGEKAGTYSVTVIANESCPKTASLEVENTQCSIPKGVSVNNDGNNDTFDLTGLGVDNLKIFNRYGMTVFEQANYADQWHGQDFKGCELPSATYYYLAKLASGEAKTGWVYLIRKE